MASIIETGEGGLMLQDGTEGNSMHIKFSSKAKPVGERWEEGFKDGYDNAIQGRQINGGKYGDDWGSAGLGMCADSKEYGNGYAEGNLSGHSEFMRNKYPGHKGYSWIDGKLIIHY